MDEQKAHPLLQFTQEKRTDYLMVAASIAHAGGLKDEALDHLRSLCRMVKLSDKSIGIVMAAAYNPEGFNVSEIIDNQIHGELRFTLLTDAVSIAYAYGTLSLNEQKAIGKLAKDLKINDEQVAAIKKYVAALKKASEGGATKQDVKRLVGEALASVGSVGVPVAAVAVSGPVFGLSAAGITGGLAALGLGFGMATGVGVAVGIGVATYMGIRWLWRTSTEDDS